jgi:hypothetical protein
VERNRIPRYAGGRRRIVAFRDQNATDRTGIAKRLKRLGRGAEPVGGTNGHDRRHERAHGRGAACLARSESHRLANLVERHDGAGGQQFRGR